MSNYTLTLDDVNFDKTTGTILEYIGEARDITIPATLSGVPVTIIGPNAFCHRWLTNIALSETLERIEYGGLSMNLITKITIPESVKYIGEYAIFMEDNEIEITMLNKNADVDICAFHSMEYIDGE